MPSVTMVGYVRHILGRGRLFGLPNPGVKIGLKLYSIFQNHFVNSHDYSKAMVKFRSKFQFESLLQFYRTAEKVTKIKLVMVLVESFEEYHHLFNLHLVTILFLFFSQLRFKHTKYKGSLT